MRTEYLREFIAITESQSYITAADRLFLTQATLTRHIQSLERELGVELFSRTTRKVQTSEAGSHILPYAKQLVALEDRMAAAIQYSLRQTQNELSVGSILTMREYRITDMLIGFQSQYPDITIHLQNGHSDELEQDLIHDRCDIVFIRHSFVPNPQLPDNDLFRRTLFTTDEWAVLLPEDHALAKQDSIDLSQLKSERLLLGTRNSVTSQRLEELLERSGVSPNSSFYGVSLNVGFDMVKRHAGVIMGMRKPMEFLCAEESGTVTRPLQPAQKGNIYAISKRQNHSGALDCFWRYMRAWLRAHPEE